MALINYSIPKRNYELIRDRIGQILYVELNNQYLNYNPLSFTNGVWVERKKPIDKDEIALVNVTFISGSFDNKRQGAKDGTYQFGIDVYTRMASKDNQPGDSNSQKAMESLLAICDYILEDPQYRTLGFAPPSIGNMIVSEIQIHNQNVEDASNVAMGRLILNVRVNEPNQLLLGTLLLISVTTLNLSYTSTAGYQYIST